jgi:hypothetical protein
LPDGTVLPELGTSPVEFFYDNDTREGYKKVITEPLTSQAGVLTLTFNLRLKETDVKLCSSRLNVTIYDSDTPTDPTITDVQYHDLLEVIDNNQAYLDAKKLDKDFRNLGVFNDVLNKDEYVAINNGENVEKIALEKLYNKVESVNGVTPDTDKNVNLTGKNIIYNDSNIEDTLNALEEDKATRLELNTAVFHRDGTLIEGELSTNGVLNVTVDIQESGDNTFGRIILTDGKYIDGDIVDVTINITTIEEKHAQYQFTRLVDTQVSKDWKVSLINDHNELYRPTIHMWVNDNIAYFQVSDGYLGTKISDISAMVRR